MVGSQLAKTAVIYTSSDAGNLVPVYDGTNMRPWRLCPVNTAGACELTLTLGANWTGTTVYDYFVTISGGVPTPCTVAWTNTTTRATNLQRFNGVLTNQTSATCRTTNAATITVAANQGTYVGSFLTDTTAGQVTWNVGSAASGGGAASLQVCNYYNRKNITAIVVDSGAGYAYSGVTRQARGSAGNQVNILQCLQEDGMAISYFTQSTTTTNSVWLEVGIGVDTTTAFTFQIGTICFATNNTLACWGTTSGNLTLGQGLHVVSANELSQGAGNSFDVGAANTLMVTARL
jgi:hypothetical protein